MKNLLYFIILITFCTSCKVKKEINALTNNFSNIETFEMKGTEWYSKTEFKGAHSVSEILFITDTEGKYAFSGTGRNKTFYDFTYTQEGLKIKINPEGNNSSLQYVYQIQDKNTIVMVEEIILGTSTTTNQYFYRKTNRAPTKF